MIALPLSKTLLLLALTGADAAIPTPVDLLRDGTPLVASIDDGAGLLAKALDSRLLAAVRATPEWDAWWKSKEIREGWSALRLFSDLMQQPPRDALADALGLHVDIGLRPRGDGKPAWLVWTRTRSPAIASRLAEVVTHLVTLASDDESFDDQGDVRSANGAEFHAVLDDAFLISNDQAWLEAVVARARQAATLPAGTGPPGLRMAIDLAALRRDHAVKPLPQRHDNALTALMLHGVFGALNQAARADLGMVVDDDGVHLTAVIPVGAGDSDGWFFTAPCDLPPPAGAGTLGWYRITRDFADFYDRRAELLDPALEANWIEFDNVMSIFFAGRAFGAEVLGALGAEAQLIVSEQSYAELAQAPDARIPAFALVTPLDPATLRKNDLIIAFQTAMGIINADRAQNGLDPLMMAMTRHGDVEVSSATYLEWEGEGPPPMQYNFSPSIAICDGRLILGSAREQVLAIIDAIQTPAVAKPSGLNSELVLRVPAILSVLRANRRPLVADRMLKEGETSAQANLFFDRLETLLTLIDEGSARLQQQADGLHLAIELAPAPAKREQR